MTDVDRLGNGHGESGVFFFFWLGELPNLKVITFAFGDEIEIGGAGGFKLPVTRG